MPQAYEKIRDRFIQKGMSRKAAEGHAAAIFNGKIAPKTGQPFVTGNSDRAASRSKKTPKFNG